MVTHIMSQTLSRITIVFYLVVVERLQKSVKIPSDETLRELRNTSVAQLLNLQSTPGTKITRDIMATIANFLCPNLYAKLTVTDAMARQFHHTPRVHEMSYSSSQISVDTNGNNISQSITLATEWHSALGEPRQDSEVQHAETVYREPSSTDLNAVAAIAYSNPAASVTGVQNLSVRHVLSQNRHLIVKSGCGTGKSGVYILPLLYARSFGVRAKKFLVISPYNALLSQHVQQARRYFRGMNLSVEGILSSDVGSLEMRARFNSNLTFVSIEAFRMLKEEHEDVLKNSSFDVCVIDEVHNIFEELFRHSTWASLKMISLYGWKLVALSATINDFITEKLAGYLGISGHVDKVGCQEYMIPDVAIRHVRVPHHCLLKRVTEFVKQTAYYDAASKSANKCHIVTATRDDASDIQSLLSDDGIETAVLTSLTNKEERETIMERWGNDPKLTVLATTLIDGIDSEFTQTVVIVKHAGSVVKTIQAIGRIRPPKQLGRASLVCYFHTDFDPGVRQEDLDRNQLVLQSLFCTTDDEAEKKQARWEFARLFQSGGLDDVFNDGEGCLRQDLYRLIGVDSPPCGICSKCNIHNHVAMAASRALDQQLKETQLRMRVISSLAEMGKACSGCLSPDCNGFKCVNLGTGNSNVCIKCHGVHVSGNKCIARFIDVRGNACPYCFLPFHKDIDGTDIQFHQRGECIHKDRIRHVLLWDLRDSNDDGQRAHNRLVTCSANHDEWFATMERNLRKMKDSEISRAATSTDDDAELMKIEF